MQLALQSPFFLIRFLSILLVAFALSTNRELFAPIFLSFLFCHYVLAFIYSKHQVIKLAKDPTSYLPILILAGIFLGIMLAPTFPFPIIIGLHIALSEVYMQKHQESLIHSNIVAKFNLARILLNSALFVVLTRSIFVFSWINVPFLVVTTTLCLLFFLYICRRAYQPENKKYFIDLLLFEALGVAIAIFSLIQGLKLTHQDIVFYHITTWLFFPMFFYFKNNIKKQYNLIFLNVVISTVFYLYSQFAIFPLNKPLDLSALLPIFVSLHVLSSLCLSSMNPSFISRYFYKNQISTH